MTWLIPLILGTGFGLWTSFPLAAWLSAIFLLRASRLLAPRWSYLAIVLATTVTGFVTTRGLTPGEPVSGLVMAASGALLVAGVFLADRLLHARLNRWAGLFLLPAGITFLEFMNAAGSPFGSWGSWAYTQYGVPPLMQLASLTGIWGLSFLIALAATVVNQAWQEGWRPARPLLVAYLALLAGVGVYGTTRLMAPLEGPQVRIAGLTVPTRTPSGELLERAQQAGADASAWEALEADAAAVTDRLLDLTAQEAAAGAGVILWSEANALLSPEGEAALMARAQTLARDHGALLGLSLATVTRRDPLEMANRLVLLGPEGVRWDYTKAKLTPGLETEIGAASTASIPVAETAFGRISGAIGFDADFPPLLYPAGKEKVALLLSPAHDWAGIAPAHTRQAIFRAIEQGFTLFRPARDGWSVVADPRGRLLAERPSSEEAGVLRADVPVTRLPAPYTDLGDLFPFACMLAFLGLVGTATLGGREEPETPQDERGAGA